MRSNRQRIEAVASRCDGEHTEQKMGFMLSNRVARLGIAPIHDCMESILVRHKPRLWLIVLAVLVSAMVGCGNSTIVGQWRLSGDSDAAVWEFSKNGSILIGNVRGRYKFGDQNRLKIETPFATSVYQLQISGDRMTLREVSGSKLEFTRIK
jgi:hypothetical protein